MSQSRGRPSMAALAASDSRTSRLRERVLRVLGGTAEAPFRLRRAVAGAAIVTFSFVAIGVLCIHAAGVNDERFADFDFDNPPAAYEKEIRVADAQHSIKAGSLRFKLSEYTRGKDDSLEASLGLPEGYEVVSFRLFDHATRKLIHDSDWQLNKDNDPSTRKFQVERIGETARITIRKTGGELPTEIDLWLRIVENGGGKPIVIPARQGAVVKVGGTEIAVASLLEGIMSGQSDATGQMIWDVSSAHNTKWTTTIDLQNRGADLEERYHLVAVTKSGWRHAMDHKHFLEFPRHLGRFEYVQLDVGLDDIDHFELIPFHERDKFFFNAVSVPPSLQQIGATTERWIGDQSDRAANSYLDLETGRAAPLPAAFYESTPPGKDAERWQDSQGMDVLGDIRDGLVGLKTRFAKVSGEWDKITASQVTGALEQVHGDPDGLFLLPRIVDATTGLRRVESEIHAFQTSGGEIGLIQIVGVDRRTRRQKVRYKLSRKAAALLVVGQRDWTVGETPVLKSVIRNRGEREWEVAQARQLCELQVEGRWYQWVGTIRVRSSYFPPGKGFEEDQGRRCTSRAQNVGARDRT